MSSYATMKQRETRRKTGNEGAVFHASTARTSFPLRVYARNATKSCGWCAFYTLPCMLFHTPHYIHSARTRVAY
ncbi:hypothetical protein Y032_0048g1728 [Ancylostoma ceylanicum]|uniref:Uncharacterized protein n=1 Tax=Ancylostoma ceylanicum TaxID=53326 RepID=A0A016UAX1_9BILA|nr:hypothetical protein Y032_0048g1728 [Ancylostoma ceylanicum]